MPSDGVSQANLCVLARRSLSLWMSPRCGARRASTVRCATIPTMNAHHEVPRLPAFTLVRGATGREAVRIAQPTGGIAYVATEIPDGPWTS